MNEGLGQLLQLGGGGLLALLLVREFNRFAEKRKENGNGSSSNGFGRTPDFWLRKFDAIDAVLAAQTQILQRMEENQTKVSDALIRIIALQESTHDAWRGNERRHART